MMRETIIASEVGVGADGQGEGSVACVGESLPPGASAGLAVVGGGDTDAFLKER